MLDIALAHDVVADEVRSQFRPLVVRVVSRAAQHMPSLISAGIALIRHVPELFAATDLYVQVENAPRIQQHQAIGEKQPHRLFPGA